MKTNRRIAELRYLLAREYLKDKRFKEAKNEFISSVGSSGKINYRPYLYILTLSLGTNATEIVLKLIPFYRKVLSKAEDYFKAKEKPK